jgi:hypothetical protein
VSKTENIEQLERQLATFVSVKDDAGVRRIYRELLEAGRSRAEVTAMLLRASSGRPELSEGTSAGQKPGPSGATRSDMDPPAENIRGSGAFTEEDISAPILLDSDRGSAVQGCSHKGDDAQLCINEFGLKIDPPRSKILRRFMLPILIILVASLGLFLLGGADQSHSGPAAFSIIPTTGPSELEVAERDHWSEPVSIAAAANRAVSPTPGGISPGGNWKEADEPASATGVVPVPSSASPQRIRGRDLRLGIPPVHANARPRPPRSNKNGHAFPSHIPRYSVWYYGHTLPTRHYALSYEGYMTARSTGWSGGQFGPAPYSASGQ